MDIKRAYKAGLHLNAMIGNGNFLIFIFSQNDCETKNNGLFYDFVMEEIRRDSISVTDIREVELSLNNTVLFE